MQLSTRRWPVEGPRNQPKILLLHGMGGTGMLWRPIAAGLEDSFDILAPDQRGHGQSQIAASPSSREPVRYTPLEYGEDLVETLGTLAFYPAWVVGHSMGVRSACALAHLRPDWVRGLILIDLGFSGMAGGGLGEGLATFIRVLPESFANRAEARAFMERECPDPAIAQYLMAVSVTRSDGTVTFPFDHRALIETILAARDVSVRPWIEATAARGTPVLILRGAKSLVWSHEEFETERRAFSSFPSVTFEEVEGAGHGLPFEKRPQFIARLKSFMKSFVLNQGPSA